MNRPKAAGTAWETRVVKFLQGHGFPTCMRQPLSGKNDKGDIANIPGVVIECKNRKSLELAMWVDEMVKEKANAGADIGVVVIPRRNHSIERAYVIQELGQWVKSI